jgi:hypothetical protein
MALVVVVVEALRPQAQLHKRVEQAVRVETTHNKS